jgi:hypothetical protein
MGTEVTVGCENSMAGCKSATEKTGGDGYGRAEGCKGRW